MTTMTRRGATVEEAVAAALQSLNVSRDEVEIDVIDEGRKGFLGFGVKQAEVIVTVIKEVKPDVPTETGSQVVNEQAEEVVTNTTPDESKSELLGQTEELEEEQNSVEETKRYLEDVAIRMGIKDLEVIAEIDGKYVNFRLESSQAALLIGKRGQTLNALQQLAQLVVNKSAGQFKVLRIDVGDYRERRRQSLEHLAERMADSAVRTGRKVQLEPMPSYERKVIHHTLSSRLDIETHSEGTDPYRYLVIQPIR